MSIICQLIIDDGVSNRGHRTNIFKPAYKVCGIGVGPHKGFKHMCCIRHCLKRKPDKQKHT